MISLDAAPELKTLSGLRFPLVFRHPLGRGVGAIPECLVQLALQTGRFLIQPGGLQVFTFRLSFIAQGNNFFDFHVALPRTNPNQLDAQALQSGDAGLVGPAKLAVQLILNRDRTCQFFFGLLPVLLGDKCFRFGFEFQALLQKGFRRQIAGLTLQGGGPPDVVSITLREALIDLILQGEGFAVFLTGGFVLLVLSEILGFALEAEASLL